MAKRTVTVILILLLLLPAAISAGGVLFAPESPFREFDQNRENSIIEALSGEISSKKSEGNALSEDNRYIVKFKDDAEISEIEKALYGSQYRLLAESKHKLFAVIPEKESFFEENRQIIDYSEPDLIRQTMAVPNDPVYSGAYEKIGIYTAWDTVTAKSEVIVAVLDTGVSREHEDLRDANILAGYDAVERVAGVDEDTVGHGTGVIGIIAATANNGIGIAGVAHGVTILPIKVSASGTTIYSSDLIAGIRFAADSGAKIINMSLGGYSKSDAEQEAVNYAIEKGCILVSAAGNGGNRPYADQKSYPASYDGVISVASYSPNGERSDFSQYNDAVDVAAPGEMITIPYTENGESLYKTDSGTSYSCAFISGIAALAASKINENARFDSEEFNALIIDSCGHTRTDAFGYGKISATEIIRRINLPIVTGIYNNGTFTDSVKIGFNRGTATLDGEQFEDGETVIANGKHTLTVTDGEVSRTYYFRLDYDPLSYEFKEFPQFAYFDFDRGEALLDGFPYKSGDRISASGKHEFVLKDGEESLKKEIYLQYSLPTVFGIEDGETYENPVDIRIIGDGTAELDGNAVYEEVTVAESGTHTLTVTSGNGAITKEYSFTIDFENSSFTEIDYEFSKAAVDEENGYICIYGDTLVGARIYDIDSPEKYLHFLPIGRIYSHAFTEESLLLFGDNGITSINRRNARSPEDAVNETVSIEGIDYYVFAEGDIYCFGNRRIYRLDHETRNLTFIAELDLKCEAAYYSNGLICILTPSTDRLARIFNVESRELYTFDIGKDIEDMPLCFGEGYLAVGKSLIEVASGRTVLEFCSNMAIKIESGVLYTENRIIDIASGKEIGSFSFLVSDIASSESANYIFGQDPILAIIGKENSGVSAYCAAERLDKAFSEQETINPYRQGIFYGRYSQPISADSGYSEIYVLFENKNSLYGFSLSDFSEIEPVPLRFTPKNVYVSDGYVAISFVSAQYVYLAPETDLSSGVYISLPSVCESAVIANGRLYASAGGRLIHCAVDGSEMAFTSIQARSIKTDGERIYASDGAELTVYSTALTRLASAAITSDDFFVGSGVAVDGKIYDRTLNSVFATISENVLEFGGNAIVSELGVFDVIQGKYIGSFGVKEIRLATICGNNSLVSFGSGLISVCSYGDESEIITLPQIEGIAEGERYLDHITVDFDRGIGFIDGEQIDPGHTVSGAGQHNLIVVLPCGQSLSMVFYIEAQIESIEFLVGDRTMSVGESITLQIKYLPDGASSVPVQFTSDSDQLSIDEGGKVTALAVGEFSVTAIAETDYGKFSAKCKITVRDDLIVFDESYGLTIDRDNGLVFGIPAGTTADALLKMLYSSENASLIDSNGARVKGFAGTGHKIILASGGNVTDMLSLVVIGDTDGDGCITAYDLYVLERILKGYSYASAYTAAADMNRNGILADNDYRELRNIVLTESLSQEKPPENLFGLSTVQTVTRIESGSIIDVVVCISGCKYARGISGVIEFGEGLEFIEGVSTGWESDYLAGENSISFYAYAEDGKECGTAFKLIINLKFKVTAEAGETVSLSCNGLKTAFNDGCRMVRFEALDLFVYEPATGDFKIDFLNAHGFEFDPEKYEYNVSIPYNSALADITVTRAIGQMISVSELVVNDSGENTVTVSVYSPNGSNKLYTIHVKRDSEPRFDSNCRLATLEVEGHKLSPPFNPDIHEYSISVPDGTEKINIYCVAQNPTAKVIIGDTKLYGEENAITITVGTPDGETLIYTVNVKVLPPVEESSDVSGIGGDEDSGVSVVTIIIIAIGIIAAAVIIALYIRVYKNDAENKAKELESAQGKPESIEEQSKQIDADNENKNE